ncbi:MAG: hypothetical protein ACFB8W_03740 [Elainellaceae cyanobacterium]
MPAKGKIEIRIRFSGVPLSDPYRKGITRVEVDGGGYAVFADIKTKTFKRFLESAREFDYWEGALSGTLDRIHGYQIMLSDAGLQCYEKKPSSGSQSF